MSGIENRQQGLLRLITGILFFGSLWGLSEVALGGGLRAASFPYRAGLLTAIGMAIMGIALANFRKPLMLVGIGSVAMLVNLLAVPLLHVSVACKANSCIAVGLESASLGLVAVLLMAKAGGSVYARMGSGAFAAVMASAAFYFVGTHVAPCNYLLSFTSPGTFVVQEGLVWAAFSAVLFPLGYLAGERLAVKPLPALAGRGLAYYATAAGAVILCLGFSALAIVSGL